MVSPVVKFILPVNGIISQRIIDVGLVFRDQHPPFNQLEAGLTPLCRWWHHDIDLSLNKTLPSDRVWCGPGTCRGRATRLGELAMWSNNGYFHFLIPDIIDGNIDAAHISEMRTPIYTVTPDPGWWKAAVWAQITHRNQYWVIHNRPLPNPCDIKTSKLKPTHSYCTVHSCPQTARHLFSR